MPQDNLLPVTVKRIHFFSTLMTERPLFNTFN